MISAYRLQKTFSPEAMLSDLAIVDQEIWQAVIPQKEGGWTGLALRSHDGKVSTLEYRSALYVDTPLLREMPYFQEVVSFFKCRLFRVRLLSMKSGARIGRHVDTLPEGLAPQVRLHVPIITNPEVTFTVDDFSFGMSPGEVWYMDVMRPHSVSNNGSTPRIHLVIDCEVDEWLRAQLR